jgi:hypothetical protein
VAFRPPPGRTFFNEAPAPTGLPYQAARKVLQKYIPGYYSAIAILSNRPVSTLRATMITVITPPPVPVQIFGKVIEARTWLIDRLRKERK